MSGYGSFSLQCVLLGLLGGSVCWVFEVAMGVVGSLSFKFSLVFQVAMCVACFRWQYLLLCSLGGNMRYWVC